MDATYGYPTTTLRFPDLAHPTFPGSVPFTSVQFLLQCELNHLLHLSTLRSTSFCTGYTEVNHLSVQPPRSTHLAPA